MKRCIAFILTAAVSSAIPTFGAAQTAPANSQQPIVIVARLSQSPDLAAAQPQQPDQPKQPDNKPDPTKKSGHWYDFWLGPSAGIVIPTGSRTANRFGSTWVSYGPSFGAVSVASAP